MAYQKEMEMTDKFCKKCNHLCHCIEADHFTCKCENCECGTRDEALTYENEVRHTNGEVIIDSTGDCESCQ